MEALFNPNAITKIFSYSEMAKKHFIATDSAKDDAFIVNLQPKKFRFKQTTIGLYVFVPTLEKNNKIQIQILAFIEGVQIIFKVDMKFYTCQQIKL
jgi:hypothetical protein